jgi:CRP-like cAMP-binding protein
MDCFEIESFLENSELFKGLDKNSVQKIAGLCKVKDYDPGEYLFRQGDYCADIFIIADGHVLLERTTDLGMRKGGVLIAMLGKGRALGCWSTLVDKAHNLMSSAVCRKPTKALVINGDGLRQMMLADKEVGFMILQKLCLLLRERIQWALGTMEKV